MIQKGVLVLSARPGSDHIPGVRKKVSPHCAGFFVGVCYRLKRDA